MADRFRSQPSIFLRVRCVDTAGARRRIAMIATFFGGFTSLTTPDGGFQELGHHFGRPYNNEHSVVGSVLGFFENPIGCASAPSVVIALRRVATPDDASTQIRW